MKKCFIIGLVVSLLFILTGCAKKVVYVDQNGEVVQNPYGSKIKDYVKFSILYSDCYEQIIMDDYTGVLYYKYAFANSYGITPLMNADGTCLTYEEWKSRGANYEF